MAARGTRLTVGDLIKEITIVTGKFPVPTLPTKTFQF